MYERFLVTGGSTGFLGTNFTLALLQKGFTVHTISRLERSSYLKSGANLVELKADLRFEGMPAGMDYVIHCAAHTSGAKEAVENPAIFVLPNLTINSNVLDSAARSGVKKFVFISSSTVYPNLDYPLSEKLGFEGDAYGPHFGVGWMKRYSEKLAEFFHKLYSMEVLVIRPSNIYGPYSDFDIERAHVIPALINKFLSNKSVEVWGDSGISRDFIYVDDFVERVLLLFETFSGFEVFNVASGNIYTIGEVVNLIKELTDFQGEVIYNSSRPTTFTKKVLDISKAERVIGVRDVTPLKKGLEQTINWFKENCRGLK